MPPPLKSLNFNFLREHDPLYVQLAAQAEQAFAADPATTLVKLRQLGEALAKYAAAAVVLEGEDASQVERLRALERAGILDRRLAELFHTLRRRGNEAAHENRGTHAQALGGLRIARQLSIWFHRSFGGGAEFKPRAFISPQDPRRAEEALKARLTELEAKLAAHHAQDELRALQENLRSAQAEALKAKAEAAQWEEFCQSYDAALQKQEEVQAKFQARLAALQARRTDKKELRAQIQALIEASAQAAGRVELSEAETRVLIDEQLRAAGWEADSERLRYSVGARPAPKTARAIAEYPTASGPADYVLFLGMTPLAVVEAKRAAKNVSAALEQAKRYSRDIRLTGALQLAAGARAYIPKLGHSLTQDGPVGAELGWFAREHEGKAQLYKIPFLFSTNGRPYHQQYEELSGVWFLDAREPTNHPRALDGWYTPEGLKALLARDDKSADEKLKSEALRSLDLRDYQRAAISAVERALAAGQRRCLLSMATGTGKTRTIIGLLYRLLKNKRAGRALFLVDRSALGAQAMDSFSSLKMESGLLFTEIFEVADLSVPTPEPTTKVHLATVQGMVRRLEQSEDEGRPLPVDSYDLIIVDESHRGYTLDRDMSEAELELRSTAQYISAYRRVLDHFDAIRVGLTATPALHTRQIFGAPVFSYTYPEAVIDGWLVDHAPALRFKTRLSTAGIHFDAGSEVTTLEGERETLPDELNFDVSKFNSEVIAESFTAVVCAQLAERLDPTGDEKTLVFCVNDKHAGDVVRGLKRAFEEAGAFIPDGAIMKITGRTDKYPEQIRRFKNERNPNIAVTVDLLTTGIDVPNICNLVFIRRVKSRILYEQMLGRATRLPDRKQRPNIEKDLFYIYDFVDIYASLQRVSDMKPVVVDPSVPTSQLLTELLDPRSLELDGRRGSHADDLLAQLIVRLHASERRLSSIRHPPAALEMAKERLELAAGAPLLILISQLRAGGAVEAARRFTEAPALMKAILALRAQLRAVPTKVIIAPHSDDLIEAVTGYGGKKPEDYLSAFHDYIEAHKNELTGLNVVLTRPRELTRQSLRELELQLAEAGYTESQLQSAYKETKNADIAARIVGFIRQQALGSPLLPYEARVDRALRRVLKGHHWTKIQENWLTRIASQLKAEAILDRESFEAGAFASAGGYARVDKTLGGQLSAVLGELSDEIWSDEGAA